METRDLKVILTKVGGTASEKSIGHRITIPNKWAKDMEITEEDRILEVTYDDRKKEIVLRKKVKNN